MGALLSYQRYINITKHVITMKLMLITSQKLFLKPGGKKSVEVVGMQSTEDRDELKLSKWHARMTVQ